MQDNYDGNVGPSWTAWMPENFEKVDNYCLENPSTPVSDGSKNFKIVLSSLQILVKTFFLQNSSLLVLKHYHHSKEIRIRQINSTNVWSKTIGYIKILFFEECHFYLYG